MKKKKFKIGYKKFFMNFMLPLACISLILYFALTKSSVFNTSVSAISNTFSGYSSKNVNNYNNVKIATNPDYHGTGQTLTSGDGYSTTFTTKTGRTYIEYKQNGSASWANNPYWSETMSTDGCGITAMSIILSGFGLDYNPERLRETYFPVLKAEKISSELTNYGVKNTDFFYDSTHLSSNYILSHLENKGPVLICVWNKPCENRWTTQSHYMALLASDSKGLVYVSNPNGLDNSNKSSGWYNLSEEIIPYLAKALFIEA